MINILDGEEINRIFKLTNSRVNVSCKAGFGRINHFHYAILSNISSFGLTVHVKISNSQVELTFEWRDIVSIERYINE